MKARALNGIHRAISVVGSQARLANKCKLSRAAVNRWVKNIVKNVSVESALAIERATNGEVKKSELRPDIWPPASGNGLQFQ